MNNNMDFIFALCGIFGTIVVIFYIFPIFINLIFLNIWGYYSISTIRQILLLETHNIEDKVVRDYANKAYTPFANWECAFLSLVLLISLPFYFIYKGIKESYKYISKRISKLSLPINIREKLNKILDYKIKNKS